MVQDPGQTQFPEQEGEPVAPSRRRRRRGRQASAETPAPAANASDSLPAPEEAQPAAASRSRRGRRGSRAGAESSDASSAASDSPAASEEAQPAAASRGRRGRRGSQASASDAAQSAASDSPPASEETQPAAASRSRRGRRGSRARADSSDASSAASDSPATSEEAQPAAASRSRRGRRGSRASADAAAQSAANESADAPEKKRAAPLLRPGERRTTAQGAVIGMPAQTESGESPQGKGASKRGGRRAGRRRGEQESPAKAFMHPSEKEFADLLDYYKINYLYEPRSFPLRWDGSRVVEMFTPDFYLPEHDQYFELTTMKQNLVTQKNRKLRRVREMYPEVNVQLLYRKDLMRLMGKYGFGPLAGVSVEGTERVLFDEARVQERVRELGARITEDYAGEEPVLIGVLRGVVVFMADLMRAVNLPMQVEFMEITHYGEERQESIDVIRDVTTDLTGRHALVVEDIADTGLTLRYLREHLEAKGPASLRVCALLDKSVRRMTNVHLDYVGFEIPDEFVIGYGLDYGGRYRNLPYIGVLQPPEPKAVAQR